MLVATMLPVSFAYPEQRLLPGSSSLFEELMCWEGSMDVPKYDLKHWSNTNWQQLRTYLLIRSLFGDQDTIVLNGALHLLTCST